MVAYAGTLHQTYSEGRSFERDSSIQRTLWPLKPSLLENDMQINKFFLYQSIQVHCRVYVLDSHYSNSFFPHLEFFLHQSIQVHCRVYVLDSHYSGSFFPHLEFSLFLSFFPALIW
ncbi:hypothetical protein GmHk_04G011245 [Glycine max]|nr:hypothetical protein GmHk_04G011245 [Glycine max]